MDDRRRAVDGRRAEGQDGARPRAAAGGPFAARKPRGFLLPRAAVDFRGPPRGGTTCNIERSTNPKVILLHSAPQGLVSRRPRARCRDEAGGGGRDRTGCGGRMEEPCSGADLLPLQTPSGYTAAEVGDPEVGRGLIPQVRLVVGSVRRSVGRSVGPSLDLAMRLRSVPPGGPRDEHPRADKCLARPPARTTSWSRSPRASR